MQYNLRKCSCRKSDEKVETKQWFVDNPVNNLSCYPQIQEAAQLLRDGEVIGFPTETVYGLGADAMSNQAVEKIFLAKGRPSDNPLIVHIAMKEQLQTIVTEVPLMAEKLMDAFWPGPLTIILPKKDGLSEKVTAGLDTVGVRMPSHPVALALLKAADVPVAAPSANRSGRPSPTTARHVYDDLKGKIAGVIDGGTTGVGVESTVVDCTGDIPIILRPGGVTREQLEEVVGIVVMDESLKNEKITPKSPGMKYTHYAPDAPLVIVEGSKEFLQEIVNKEKQAGKKIGVLTTAENQSYYQADVVLACGERRDLSSVAQHLYDVLRRFNDYDIDAIYSESFTEKGIGQAIMNRLTKASGHRFLKE